VTSGNFDVFRPPNRELAVLKNRQGKRHAGAEQSAAVQEFSSSKGAGTGGIRFTRPRGTPEPDRGGSGEALGDPQANRTVSVVRCTAIAFS
jgi:hypothetical protein